MASLNENIIEVGKIFKEIAKEINEHPGVTDPVTGCDGPSTYPSKIHSIKSNSGISLQNLEVAAHEVIGPDPTVSIEPKGEDGAIITFGLRRGPKGDKGDPGAIGPEGPAGSQGNPGKDGADGTRFEYIYKLSNTKNQLDPPYSANEDGYVPEGWSDKPQGVSDDNEYEWICQREKTNGTWGTWTTPSIWAHYGKIGKDGNGIEYIFCLTEIEEQPEEPISDPDKSESEIPNYFPIEVGKWTWTDEPGETTDKIPYCWVSVRKQKYNDNGEQKWTPYSNATIWAKYARDGKEGGGRTVQVYTYDVNGDTKIPAPIGGAWDPESNAVTCPSAPEGDSHIWVDNMSLIPSKSEDGKLYHIWQSNGVFNSAGGQTSEGWSEPHRITGADGEPGKDGTSIEFIYRLIPDKIDYNTLVKWHTDQAELGNVLYSPEDLSENDIADNWTGTPSKIDISDKYEGEGWTPIEGTEQYTICDTEWKDSPDGVTEEHLIEVCCQRKYNKETEKWGPWSMPYIWSMWGEDGMDGDGVEYIYLVTPKTIEKEIITKDHIILKVPTIEDYIEYDKLNGTNYAEQYQERGFVPGVGNSNWIGNQEWTDEPCDVSFDEPIEWVRIRKYRVHEGETEPRWGDWSEPSKWAMWAEDGASFKTSFVFAVSNLDLSRLVPGKDLIGGNYSNPYPNNSVLQHGTNSDGSPKNYTITWTDAPRVPDHKSGECLWMTSRTFKAGDQNPDDIGSIDRFWSVPAKMSDTSTFQVEYTKGQVIDGVHNPEIKPIPVSFNTYYEKLRDVNGMVDHDEVEKAWRKAEADKGFIWDDYVADAVWMATSTLSNGKWSDWSVIKIKGEKGNDGTSVTIEGTAIKWTDCNLPSKQLLFESGDNANSPIKYLMYQCSNFNNGVWTLMMWTDPDEDGVGSYQQYDSSKLYNGFGILVDSDLWVWDGDSWENVGQIKGDVGDSMNLYIAYSNDPAVLTIDNPDSGVDIESVEIFLDKVGKYIGYFTDFTARSESYLLNPNLYKWSQWIGDDGWGWEQIFLLTKYDSEYTFDNPPAKPTTSEQVKDYLPEHGLGDAAKTERWTDLFDTPTADYPFCWTTRRTASTNEWGTEWEPVALYSRYVSNATHLELSEDHISIPVDIANDNSIDNDWDGADLVAYVYDGDDLRTDGVEYWYRFISDKPGEFVLNNSEVFEFSRNVFVENVNATKIEIKAIVHIGAEIRKEFTKVVHLSWNTSGYELTLNKHVLKKSVYDGGYLIPDEGSDKVTVKVSIQKWDFDKNAYLPVKEKSVYVDYSDEQGAVTEKVFVDITNQNGEVVFDELRSLINPASIKFYILKDGKSEILAFEEVGVVANGEDGASEEHIFHLSDKLVLDFSDIEFDPDTWVEQENYQKPEFLPAGTEWYDEYGDAIKQVSLEFPYCYSSARRRTKDESKGKMLWGKFQTPILYAKYSKDITSAWLSKNASIITFNVNNELSTDVIYTTLNVKSDVEDKVTSQPYISQIRVNGETLSDNNQLVTLKSGEWGDDLSVNVELTIHPDKWNPKEECEIEVDITAETYTGQHTATHEILLIKAAGESKFSIDLTDEFHYMHYVISEAGKDEFGMPLAAYRDWPSIRAMAYYGTTMLSDPITFTVTAVDQNGKQYVLKEETSIERSLDKLYWLEPNFTEVESWYKDNTGDINNHYLSGEVVATTTINGKVCETRDTFRIQKTTEDKASLNVTPAIVNLKDGNEINWSVDLPNGAGYKVTTLPSEYSVTVTHNDSEVIASNPYVVSEVGEYVFTLYCNGIKHDYEPVTVIHVTNPYLLDIDPDNDWVQTKEDGTPLTPYSKTISCRFWNGDKEVIPTYTANPTGCSVEPTGTIGSYTVKYNGNEKKSATVVFNATYNGITTSKTFTLHKSLGKPTYRIIAPAQINNTAGTKFNVTVEKIDGNDTIVYTSPQNGLVLYFKGNRINNWKGLSISSTENATELYLELQDADGAFLDGEYITLVKNGALDESQIANINKSINDAKKAVLADANKNIETARVDFNVNLENAKQYLQQAIDNGDTTATQKALEAVQTAELLSEALDSLKRSHNALSNTVNGVKNSVLNETQVKNLSIAALTEETSLTNNTVASKTVIGQQIIGLAGTFAEVQSEKIVGTNIYAKNLRAVEGSGSNLNTSGAYDLFANGSGQVAYGNIKWDSNGNVTLGSGVTIDWSTVIQSGEIDTRLTRLDKDGIYTGTLNADKIVAGTLDCSKITIKNLTVGEITSIADSGKAFNLSGTSFSFGNGALTGNSDSVTFTGNVKVSNNTASVTFGKTFMDSGMLIDKKESAKNGLVIRGSSSANNTSALLFINDHSSSGYGIYCNSKIYSGSSMYASGYYATSDETLKHFRDDVTVDFDKLKSIPKKYFTWKSDDSVLEIGTSAQEIQKIYPELVSETEGILRVDYSKLSIIALSAVDKLYEELQAVKQELQILKNK